MPDQNTQQQGYSSLGNWGSNSSSVPTNAMSPFQQIYAAGNTPNSSSSNFFQDSGSQLSFDMFAGGGQSPSINSFGQQQNQFGGYGNMATWGQGVQAPEGNVDFMGKYGDDLLKGGQLFGQLWGLKNQSGMLDHLENTLATQNAFYDTDLYNRGTDAQNQLNNMRQYRSKILGDSWVDDTKDFRTSTSQNGTGA